ncbi:aldehyde dehydrogenase family protein [Candidatus Pelagibacter sp.]|nr:aldehyde dehydrogenase family protein [Candidatus Pelagibacter sp.]
MLDKKKFYINGQWVSPKKLKDYSVIDPSTEEECAVISLGGEEDVNDAVNAASKAFETWAFSTKAERLKYLEALYEVYKKRWADMAKAISLEMGAPIDFSTQLQAGTGASHIKTYIKVLKSFTFEKMD